MLIDEHVLILHLDTFNGVPLLQGMLDDRRNRLLMKCVGYIEHVVPVTLSALGVLIGEVLSHVGQGNKLFVKALD